MEFRDLMTSSSLLLTIKYQMTRRKKPSASSSFFFLHEILLNFYRFIHSSSVNTEPYLNVCSHRCESDAAALTLAAAVRYGS